MSDDEPSNIAQPLGKKLGGGRGSDWDGATLDPSVNTDLLVHVEDDNLDRAADAIAGAGGAVDLKAGGEVHAKAPAQAVYQIADLADVRFVTENVPPEPKSFTSDEVSEGVAVSNTDLLHDNENLTGSGITVGVIDLEFDPDNPKFGPTGRDQIQDKIGPSGAFYSQDGLHGTASAEVVSDMAPDANIVLASAYEGLSNIFSAFDSADYTVDVVTMSLGYRPDRRIDGLDGISATVQNDFTSNGKLLTVAAGNEANGPHWDGPYRDSNGNGLLEFDDQGTEQWDLYTYKDFFGDSGGNVIVHWDDDWNSPSNEFELRLYDANGSEVATSYTTGVPFEMVEVPTISDGSSTKDYYIEVERKTGSDTSLHFDAFGWGNVIFYNSTPQRSVGIPATSQDDRTLSVVAVQATSTGRTQENYLKPYSSRGPTQDGRQGLDIAGPSKVSQTANGYDTLDNGGGYNGTSAATPHIGGAIGALLEDTSLDIDGIRDSLVLTGGSIAGDGNDNQSSVADPPNRKIGGGYMDADSGYDALNQLGLTLVPDTTSQNGDAQISIDAQAMNEVTIEDLWLDWDVSWDTNATGFTDNSGSDGTLTFSWDYTTATDVQLTVSPPSRYVGGEYVLTVTTSDGQESITLDTSITIQ